MKKLPLILFIAIMTISNSQAQENLNYQLPPESILQLADFQRAPAVTIDSHQENMLLSYRDTYKSLDDLNQQEISLAGLRVNPVTNISSSMSYISNLKVRKVFGDEPVQVKGLPQKRALPMWPGRPTKQKWLLQTPPPKVLNFG